MLWCREVSAMLMRQRIAGRRTRCCSNFDIERFNASSVFHWRPALAARSDRPARARFTLTFTRALLSLSARARWIMNDWSSAGALWTFLSRSSAIRNWSQWVGRFARVTALLFNLAPILPLFPLLQTKNAGGQQWIAESPGHYCFFCAHSLKQLSCATMSHCGYIIRGKVKRLQGICGMFSSRMSG